MSEAWLSVVEAAQLLDVDRRTVQRWARRGRLASRDEGHKLLVSAADVAREVDTARRDIAATLPQSAPQADQQPNAAITLTIDWPEFADRQVERANLYAHRVGELEEQLRAKDEALAALTAERDELAAKHKLLEAPQPPATPAATDRDIAATLPRAAPPADRSLLWRLVRRLFGKV